MATPALSNLVPLRGLLGGDGSKPLYVSVTTGPVPSEPPSHLAGVVRPVYDKDGCIADWRLDLSGPNADPDVDVISAYRNWYPTFAVHRYVGEMGFAKSFLKWARPRCSVS